MIRPRAYRIAPLSLIILGVAGQSALAQTSGPSTQGGRFALQPVEGGVIRMDAQSGALSMCKKQSGEQWACESLPDERKALQLEIDRLTKENGELAAEMKRLEDDLKKERHADAGTDRPGVGGGPTIGKLPTEDDVDKAMNYLKGMYKKLKEKLREFEDLDGKKTERL